MTAAALEILELTPPGTGAVSVIAVRGRGALALVRSLAPRQSIAPGRLSHVHLFDASELLDEGLVWAESEERVELHLHGSPAAVRRVLARLGPSQERRMKSLEERAEELLIHAPSEAAARILLDQAQGALRAELEALRRANPEEARLRLSHLLATERVVRRLLSPPLVVIAGPVNAGKSTLFNLLVGTERAIVHPEAGTTRDALRERARIGAYAVELVDTAGERETGEKPQELVERAGQEIARTLARSADLVLWLAPLAARRAPLVDSPAVRVLRSRADEAPGAERGEVEAISAKDPPQVTRSTIERVFLDALDLPSAPWTGGAPALFEPEQARRIERLLAGGLDRQEILSELDPLLAG